MKFFIFLSCLILSTCCLAQDVDCNKVHNGRFRSVTYFDNDSSVTIIKRAGNVQTEQDDKNTFTFGFTIKWTSDCTYEISKPVLLKGKSDIPFEKSDIIYVKIIEVDKTGYRAECTSNRFDQVFTLRMAFY